MRSRYATAQIPQDEDDLPDGKRMRPLCCHEGRGSTPRLVIGPQPTTGLGSRSGTRALNTMRISAADTLIGAATPNNELWGVDNAREFVT